MSDILLSWVDKLSQTNLLNLEQLVNDLIANNKQLKAILNNYHLSTIKFNINKLNDNQDSELDRNNLTITINCYLLNDWNKLVKTILKDIWMILVFNDMQADATLYVNSCIDTLVDYQFNPNLKENNQDAHQFQKAPIAKKLENNPLIDDSKNNLLSETGPKIYLNTKEEDWNYIGNKPILYHFLGGTYDVKSWTNMLTITCDFLYEKYQLGLIKHFDPDKVSKDKSHFIRPYLIKDSSFYIETNYNYKNTLKIIVKMLNWYQISLAECYFVLKQKEE